jgi:predicted hydrocarbon binding protein
MGTNRDIRIPADSIHAMRRSLYQEMGAETAGRALQEAGYAAGDALFDRLTRAASESDIAGTPSASFWDRLSSMCRELGWGTVRHEELHPGVGALVASDWFEVEPDRARALCPFTTGVFANLLGRVAGQDVAVLQVECGGDESRCARFLFGSAQALDGVYSGLREGRDVETSLSTLG